MGMGWGKRGDPLGGGASCWETVEFLGVGNARRHKLQFNNVLTQINPSLLSSLRVALVSLKRPKCSCYVTNVSGSSKSLRDSKSMHRQRGDRKMSVILSAVISTIPLTSEGTSASVRNTHWIVLLLWA